MRIPDTNWFHQILFHLYEHPMDGKEVDITQFLITTFSLRTEITAEAYTDTTRIAGVLKFLHKKGYLEWWVAKKGVTEASIFANPLYIDIANPEAPLDLTGSIVNHQILAKLTLEGFAYVLSVLRQKELFKLQETLTESQVETNNFVRTNGRTAIKVSIGALVVAFAALIIGIFKGNEPHEQKAESLSELQLEVSQSAQDLFKGLQSIQISLDSIRGIFERHFLDSANNR